ncbi:Rft-1-domain-containing protein [Heliocybe sulcata]|uniref:Man(5)GlcNAc(2)-PP-dolichol translocation protein RFT1 n=1 Tax=Heliocybe sulcata TaxID=5364 RepID=A0A5C3MTE9_9AGAM|nr:Rft-1-domain-containing protein [Heliocybe sulcata]
MSLSAASFASARLLMGLQLSVRLVTFGLNQALLRKTSPRAFGTAAIHFELLLSTILFLSREGVRNTLLRVWPSPKSDAVADVPSTLRNLTYLPILTGVPLALVASLVYYRQSSPDTRTQPHFELSVVIYALAALIELMTEPMHIRAMGELRTHVRVRAEATAVIGKALTTFLILYIDSSRPAPSEAYSLLAFALGQLTYASLLLLLYLLAYPASFPNISNLLYPKRIKSSLDPELLNLSLTFTSQSLIKHVLTEGDKLIVSRLSPLDDQGGYAVAVNYGSLVARIVFQPIEETLRLYFSKLLSPSSSPTSLTSLAQSLSTLHHLLATQLSLSLLIVTFAPPFLPLALTLLLPPAYLHTSAPSVLAAWIWYLPVLAVNGGMEAFVSSVQRPGDVNQQSRWMTAFSLLYILSALSLYSFGCGDTALVYANIASLASRIAYCVFFAQAYFASHSPSSQPSKTRSTSQVNRLKLEWRRITPDALLLAVCALSRAVIWWNAKRIGVSDIIKEEGKRALFRKDVLGHVALGVGLGVVSLGVWWLRSGQALLRSRCGKAD